MEIGERVAIGGMAQEMEVKCPFEEAEGAENLSDEREDLARDDRVTREQANNGGTLGKNLASGSPGAKGTVGGLYPPPDQDPVPRIDTPRTGVKAFVPAGGDVAAQEFPFIVSAHHCIPGEASLKPSRLKSKLMTKGASVKINGKVRKIKNHIGYNVNGAHNGVWLPGNYAIRSDTAPLKKTWSELGQSAWCKTYVAAVAAKTGSQFHDAHTEYSRAVKKLLNKIEACINLHECRLCAEKTEIPPPYLVKNRLYALSSYLRQQLQGPPGCWRRPWFASDRWRDEAFSGRAEWKDFHRTYRMAVQRRAAPGKPSTGP